MRSHILLLSVLVLGGTACSSSDASQGNGVDDASAADTAESGLDDTAIDGPSDSSGDTSLPDVGGDVDAASPDVADSVSVDSTDAADADAVVTDSASDATPDATPDTTPDATPDTPTDVSDGSSGCLSNADCAPGSFCDAPTCTGPGTCVVKPFVGVFCKLDSEVRCGCDGSEFTSTCAAHKAGVRVAHVGACSARACGAADDCASLGVGYECAFGLGNCTYAGYCKMSTFCPGFLTAYCDCTGVDQFTNECLAEKASRRLSHAGKCP